MAVEHEQEPAEEITAEDVEDPGEYNQRLRIQEISQARREASRALSGKASDAYGEQWPEFALQEVQSFVREVEWLVKQRGDRVYLEQELGPITIPPPTSDDIAGRRIISETPKPAIFPVNGLYTTSETGTGFEDLPARVSNTWRMNVQTRHQGPSKVQETIERTVPIAVTKQADSLCRRFINDVGLDARLEESDPHGQV